MADTNRCADCGAEFPPDTPPGACPMCLTRPGPGSPSSDPAGGPTMGRPSGPDTAGPNESTHEGPGENRDFTSAPPFGMGPTRADATGLRACDSDDPTHTVEVGRASSGLPRGSMVQYIGDYEIARELGRGGMGVVYEARQVSLNRPVALKILKAGLLAGDDELRRFQNEAEAVALLDHPKIVPVYEVGEHNGQQYFSMKLVRGGNLADRIGAYRADFRAAATLVAEIADAVHHAHQRGILHRDLKPANILIDAEGHPHVTDFGLAKRVEADAEMTASGAILGTPAYMSPEQASGRRGTITTATDIYGLGAVLYSLLCGRAPFSGESVVDTLTRVREQAPEAPRRVNPEAPRDLEQICLKALEKDPRRRYASADALADDLRRWLAGEPITARPVGAATRTWMWAKRKPVLASLAAALAASLLVGFIGMAALWREAVNQRNLAIDARDDALRNQRLAAASEKAARAAEAEAVAARTLAEQNARTAGEQATQALGAVWDLITRVQEDLQGPGLFDVKQALLKSALARVDGVAEVADKSKSKEATTLSALVELGRIYRRLGQTDKARKQFEKALEIARARVVVKKGNDASRRNLALTLSEMGTICEEHDRDMKAALAYHLEVVKIYEDIDAHPMLADALEPKARIRSELSEAYKLVGLIHQRTGNMKSALDLYRKSYNVLRELVPGVPEKSTDDRATLRKYYSSKTRMPLALAIAYFRTGDRSNLDVYLAEAREWAEAFLKAEPGLSDAQANLADVLYQAGELAMFSGDSIRARPSYERSRDLRRQIVKAEPRDSYQRRMLAVVLGRLGNLEMADTNNDAAKTAYAEALEILQALMQESENHDRLEMTYMLGLAHAGDVDRAVEIADRLAAGPRADLELKVEIARVCAQAAIHLAPEQAARSEALKTRAEELVRGAVRDGFMDHVYLEGEPDLVPLRDRDGLRRILDEIKSTN